MSVKCLVSSSALGFVTVVTDGKKNLLIIKCEYIFSLIFFQLEVDGEIVEMPGPFPSFDVKGNKKLFYFRIPKFNNTVIIDPTNSLGGSEGGGDAESGGDTIASTTQGPASTEEPKSNASLLPFNICALAFLLHVAAMFTVNI